MARSQLKEHFDLINNSTFIGNINRGAVGKLPGMFHSKQKLEPLKDVSNTFYADQTKAQSNYMNPRSKK
jgi:hypothetical protein|tara:strand:+ start:474 stop:680 length:207 start_codon:yes stop_codon:yes gene_type:complete